MNDDLGLAWFDRWSLDSVVHPYARMEVDLKV
jgi:hypothetical protein